MSELTDRLREYAKHQQYCDRQGFGRCSEHGLIEETLEYLAADRIDTLEEENAGLVEDIEDEEHAANAFQKELCDCQEALDMRCIDRPDKVGCSDLLFEVHTYCKRAMARIVDLERQLAEVKAYD